MKELLKSQKGMSAVEFALILPVFMLLVFAIVEFGGAFYKKQVLTSAVREGARLGVVATDPRPSTTQVEEKVYAYLDDVGLDPAQSFVTVTGAGGSSGDALKVEVSYPAGLQMLSSLLGASPGNTAGTGIATLSAITVSELE